MYRLTLKFLYFTALAFSSLAANQERLWLSNQERRDIKRHLITSLNQTHHEIFISVYALTDPKVISLINLKANQGISTQIWTDKKHIKSLKKKVSPKVHLIKRKQRGLMHHKIFVFDHNVFLGSSNLTSTSLRMHDNLILNLSSPAKTHAIKRMLTDYPSASRFVSVGFELYLLPHSGVLGKLINQINQAKREILVTLFTFTHPKIIEALIKAHHRNVKVKVLIDALSIKGASKSAAFKLKEAGLFVSSNRGSQLMHHKMCLIDQEILIFGSANWTQSAFTKNNDFIIFLDSLSASEQKWIKKLFRHLFWESKPLV